MPVHEALLAEIYQVQSAIGQMTGKPEVNCCYQAIALKTP